MIDYEILQDIITDHELCKTQKNELAKVVELLKIDRLIELPYDFGQFVQTEDFSYEKCDFVTRIEKIKGYIIIPGEIRCFLAPSFMDYDMEYVKPLTKEEAERKLAELKGAEE